MQGLKAKINNLQDQLHQINQALPHVNNNRLDIQNSGCNTGQTSILKCGKPEKFSGSNVRSWLVSIDNLFANHGSNESEESKIKYAVSFMANDALHWWELMCLNQTIFNTFEDFKKALLDYFEPVNRTTNARKKLSSLKQIGKLSYISDYNQEFSKWLLQIPDMSVEEQLFHFTEGLRYKIKVEIEKENPTTLQDAMQLADRMDRISNQQRSSFSNYSTLNRPVPIEIGNLNTRLSDSERRRCIQHKLCFICKKPNCYAAKHRRNNKFMNRRNINRRNEQDKKTL